MHARQKHKAQILGCYQIAIWEIFNVQKTSVNVLFANTIYKYALLNNQYTQGISLISAHPTPIILLFSPQKQINGQRKEKNKDI